MDEKTLKKKLNSVGKTVFVKNYDIFKDYSRGIKSKEDAVNKLVELGISNENGAGIRLSFAKQIFDADKQLEALDLVIESKRLSDEIKKLALDIKNKINAVEK